MVKPLEPNWDNLFAMEQIGINDKFTSGAYKGEYVKDVVEYNANYVILASDRGYFKPNAELTALIEQTVKLKKEKENEPDDDDEWEEIFGPKQI